MDIEFWKSFLLWNAVINYAVLLLTFTVFLAAHDWLYRFHHRWFDLSEARFDAFWYGFIGLYKLAIWFFLLVPLLVVCILR
ncbi:MAG TPA: hypothetical protein VGD21_03170 [Lysobacter sp.]